MVVPLIMLLLKLERAESLLANLLLNIILRENASKNIAELRHFICALIRLRLACVMPK